MEDFAIRLGHHPGELAQVATALSRYGVNIRSLAGLSIGDDVLVRIIADNAEAARAALTATGISFEPHEVVTVLLENRAGELAAICKRLAEAHINLYAIYLTGIVDDLVELAVVPDNVAKARQVLE
jgi:hypothetical protein